MTDTPIQAAGPGQVTQNIAATEDSSGAKVQKVEETNLDLTVTNIAAGVALLAGPGVIDRLNITGGLTTTAINALTSSTIYDALPALTTTQLAALSASNVAALTTTQISALTTTSIAALAPATANAGVDLHMPVKTGLVVVPGSGLTVAASFKKS